VQSVGDLKQLVIAQSTREHVKLAAQPVKLIRRYSRR